ncbi:MAG: PQQ-binding-like beta-propeller repeat protein [Gammaproteobacteria bacterium]|nr:PQQ-binding-like beta-propeller repeat protein [Gammaproteobacteria bacterium]MBQ0840464.1 PQQ-binding-like beta-propeller repeat protein [Gammaproteobacteria bacterium]
MKLLKTCGAICATLSLITLHGCGTDEENSTGLLEVNGTKDPYLVQYLVPGSDFLSIHGITFDSDDKLYAGSVMGQSIHQIDTLTGESTVFVGPPEGMADDLEFGPDGTLVWTSILTGQVHARRPNGEIFVVADHLPGINSIAFSPSGRLFVTQVLWGDALWELDLAGHNPPRKVIENMGHLNGFDFDKDGYLYGPLLYKGKVVKIDVDSGQMSTLASGFKIPVAVNLDSQDNLYVADTALGRLLRVDIKTGEKTLVATVEPGIDNLAINSRDELFITNMNDNAAIKINTRTGASRTIVRSDISVPGGLDLIEDNGKETLLLGNLFTYSTIDGDSGEVTDIKRGLRDHFEMPMSVNIQGEHVVVSSWFTSGVEILDRNSHQSLAVHHGFQQPVDALELIDGTLLVAEHGTGSIIEVSEDGDREVLVDEVPGIAALRQGSDDDTFYATDVLNGQLLEIDDDGDIDIIAEGLSQPEGFDVAADGSIVLAEVGKQRIVRIDPASGEITEIARNLAIGLPPAQGTPPGYIQTGVAVSAAGNIYLTSDLNTAVYKITPQ